MKAAWLGRVGWGEGLMGPLQTLYPPHMWHNPARRQPCGRSVGTAVPGAGETPPVQGHGGLSRRKLSTRPPQSYAPPATLVTWF